MDRLNRKHGIVRNRRAKDMQVRGSMTIRPSSPMKITSGEDNVG